MANADREQAQSSVLRKDSSHRPLAILALIALLVVLLLLVPSLRDVSLEPGEDLGLNDTNGTVKTGTFPPLGALGYDGMVIFMRIVYTAMLAAVAYLVIASLFDRRRRSMLFVFIVIFALCQIAVTLCSRPAEEAGDPTPREMSSGEWGESPLFDPGTEMSETPPASTGMLLLVAALVSAFVTGLSLVLYIRVIRPRRKLTAPPPESDGLHELVAQIERTVACLRQGGNAKEAVLVCYAEMA